MTDRLTQEQKMMARARRAKGESWNAIARYLECSHDVVRRAVDPGYAQHRARCVRERKARGGGCSSLRRRADNHAQVSRNPKYDPRRDAALHHESLTAAIFGDPPVGRRALDQKTRAQAS